ncbi:hypothetical protein KIN20_033809 [Parelaphostrongylus tenuis]|uniref:Uncharacterized protein n=1 Tax=Parelaphostrongylus tenuis TaxID=148309 RepID=A0AAD5WJJ0_PARTN|nr:hypothetical protein KIN20_033809 [Parelaphostrongylus tenuis]
MDVIRTPSVSRQFLHDMQTKQDFFLYISFREVYSTVRDYCLKESQSHHVFEARDKIDKWQPLSEPNAQELSPGEEQIRRHQSTEYSKALVRPVVLHADSSQR